jgi:benzoyl-CoA reductase/2-hydroxyglutaryl-CoA dehydratase subunit BcrC/BadD/HgdB
MSLEQQQREIESSQHRHARHQGMEAGEVLDTVEKAFAGNPQNMQYFYQLFRDVYCNGIKPHPGKEMIGTMCVQIPDEIIHAAGGVPVRMCNGFYTDEEIGGEFMPAKSCSLVKASLGMLKS